MLEQAFGAPRLLLAIAEHKVDLPGGNAASQNDVWALVSTEAGMVSMTVEAKARERFGDLSLAAWLMAGTSENARANRDTRWAFIQKHLPAVDEGQYGSIAYQLLHRCASAVIEANRMGLKHAACVIQAFNTPDNRFTEYSQLAGQIAH